jgi:hypothetical protein
LLTNAAAKNYPVDMIISQHEFSVSRSKILFFARGCVAAAHSEGRGRGPAGGGESLGFPTLALARRRVASGGTAFSTREPADGH